MTTQVDWGKLVGQNRVKAPGVYWTDEEMKAIKSGVSPDDVRAGILSRKEAKKEPAAPTEGVILMKTLRRMKLADLIEHAKKIGLQFNETAVTRADMILEIDHAQEKQAASDKT